MNEISSFLFGKEAGKEAKGKDGRDGRMGTGMYVCMYGRDWWELCDCCLLLFVVVVRRPRRISNLFHLFYDSNTLRNTMPKRT